MIFEVEPCIEGTKVNSNEGEYLFKTMLFSHSSLLVDESSNTLVSLIRSNWWRMDFDLNVGDKNYQLRQRILETELIFRKAEIRFYTMSGLEFYKNSSTITKVSNEKMISKKYIIEINDKDHYFALLAATCLELSLLTND